MLCMNCGNIVELEYCGHCGQKTIVERISFEYLWHELIHFFTHVEKGFLFTSIRLITRPGRTVIDFIHGKRKKYQRPVSYFLIWIAIYALLLFAVSKLFGEKKVIDYKNYFGSDVSTRYAINHLSIILSVLIPVFGFYIYLLSGRKLFNYAECLVAVIYTLGTIILLQSVFVIISIAYHMASNRALDLQLSDPFKIIYLFWFSYSFMKELPLKHGLLRSIAFTILCFGTFSMWRVIIYPMLAGQYLH